MFQDEKSREPRRSTLSYPTVRRTFSSSRWISRLTLLSMICTLTYWYFQYTRPVQYQRVCAFANAENVETALETAQQWPEFAFWFAVWKQPIVYQTLDNDRIHLIPALNSTHANGWKIAVEHAKRSEIDCEYFFAMDDDLAWRVTNVGKKSYLRDQSNVGERTNTKPTLTQVLMAFLDEYQPAFTVFEWPWGDVNHHNMTLMNEKYSGEIVQPATGFDNGCMIFHKSIVDFYIPIHLGTGHEPRFIVQHTFQNYFSAFLFKGNAIRFNGVAYVNPPTQRHPYDLPFKYMDFFLPASMCEHGRWGPYLAPEDVYWEVERGYPPYTFDDIYYISTFFDVSHSAIIDHPAIRKRVSGEKIDLIQKSSKKVLKQHCTAEAATKFQSILKVPRAYSPRQR